MRYKVSYETNERPENIPAGATVEKLTTLPFNSKIGGKSVYITRSVDGEHRAFFDAGNVWGHLTEGQTRDLYEALAEIVGETPAEPAPAAELPVTVTSMFGREVTVRRGEIQKDYVTIRVVRDDGDVTIGGMNIAREDAHKLGRALLSI